MSDTSEHKKATVPETAVKNAVSITAKLTANLEQVVTAKVGRLELKLNNAVTKLSADIVRLRGDLDTEEKKIATWAKNAFVKTKLLADIPAELGLKLVFSPVTVKLSQEESTAHWTLNLKNAYDSRGGSGALNSYEQVIPAEQTEKFFELKKELQETESGLLAVRRELSQLESKARIMRGVAAETQLREQGLEHLIKDFGDEEILALPDNVAKLIGQEKVVN